MHSAKAASILILLTIIASPTLALSHKAKAGTNDPPTQGEASESSTSGPKAPANKGKSQRFKHSPARRSSPDELSLPAVSLVSGTPEYLSGEASVTVEGNENPIMRSRMVVIWQDRRWCRHDGACTVDEGHLGNIT